MKRRNGARVKRGSKKLRTKQLAVSSKWKELKSVDQKIRLSARGLSEHQQLRNEYLICWFADILPTDLLLS